MATQPTLYLRGLIAQPIGASQLPSLHTLRMINRSGYIRSDQSIAYTLLKRVDHPTYTSPNWLPADTLSWKVNHPTYTKGRSLISYFFIQGPMAHPMFHYGAIEHEGDAPQTKSKTAIYLNTKWSCRSKGPKALPNHPTNEWSSRNSIVKKGSCGSNAQ